MIDASSVDWHLLLRSYIFIILIFLTLNMIEITSPIESVKPSAEHAGGCLLINNHFCVRAANRFAHVQSGVRAMELRMLILVLSRVIYELERRTARCALDSIVVEGLCLRDLY